MKDKVNLNFIDRINNIFSSESNKVKMYCMWCNHPIFNMDSDFGRKGLCVNCNIAYNKGRNSCFSKGDVVERILKSG